MQGKEARALPDDGALSPRHAFLGRERELGQLRAALAEAERGRGGLILLAGEPGIGKTRTAEEFGRHAQTAGADVLWGRCWESDGAPGFWPWIQVVRACVEGLDPAGLRSLLGSDTSDLSQLVPEIATRLQELLPDVTEQQPSRVRLFDAATAFLRSISINRPVVVILDDLHRADEASLRLLQYLAAELSDSKLLVIGTYRDTEVGRNHPLSTVLGEVAGQGQLIQLHGLATTDVARVVENTVGRPAPPRVVMSVCDWTAGNPFFVIEVGRMLASAGDVSETALGVPLGVRDTIRRRVIRLSPFCQSVLAVAAVIGREFELSVLHRSAELQSGDSLDMPPVLGAIDEALAASLLSEPIGWDGAHRFAHALVREALYEDLPTAEKVRLHRTVGEALEAVHGADLQPHLAALADHFSRASAAGVAEKAADYAARAGDRFATSLAYEDAEVYYTAALHALDQFEGIQSRQRRCAVLLGLGEVQHNSGKLSVARNTLDEAASVARLLDSPKQFALAAFAFSGPGEWSPDVDARAAILLQEALAQLPAEENQLRARIMGRLATVLYYAADQRKRAALVQQAVALAEQTGDPLTLAAVLGEAHFALMGSPDVNERLGMSMRVVESAEAAGSKYRALLGHSCRLYDHLQRGYIGSFEADLLSFERYAQALRHPFTMYRAKVMRAMQAIMEGRFADGERLAHEMLAAGQRAQSANVGLTFAVQIWTLRRDQGRLAEMEELVQDFTARYPALPGTRAALALLYCEIGRDAQARAIFEQLMARDLADVPRDVNWLNFLDMLAQVCADLGDAPRAALLYDALWPYDGLVSIVAFADACHGAVARSLGLLARLLGRWEDACRHFEDALVINTRLGARPYLARTQTQYAEMLLHTPAPALGAGERASLGEVRSKALRLLHQSTATYEQLGMQSNLQQARALLRRARSAREAVAEPASLTANQFRFDGKRWRVRWQGETVDVRQSQYLHYLAHLLRNPGRDVSLVELQGVVRAVPPGEGDHAYRRMSSPQLAREGLSVGKLEDSERILDPDALRTIRDRLVALSGEREEAQRSNDRGRLAAITEEIARIEAHLRAQHAGFGVEKMRKSVSKAVLRGLRSIGKANPTLGEHLSGSIRYYRRNWCYQPNPAVEWET